MQELFPNRLMYVPQSEEREDTPEEATLRKRLTPAKGRRRVLPRVCATCAYGRVMNGSFECLRAGGWHNDVGDMEHWLHVCDGYKAAQ